MAIVGSKYAQYQIDSEFSPISLACLKRATILPHSSLLLDSHLINGVVGSIENHLSTAM